MGQTAEVWTGRQRLPVLVASEGSAAYGLTMRWSGTGTDPRDLADFAYHLCLLHGRHPGIVDRALAGSTDPHISDWLERAAAAFVEERGYLVSIAAAAGPPPSTPGQAEAEATVTAQRHALDMLSQSARAGCALGAAIGLVLDWRAVRGPLDAIATRLGMPVDPLRLPDADAVGVLLRGYGAPASAERAMVFGCEQLLAQHRGLWDLLDARSGARA